ncbi:MAG: hypothetical protein COB53_13020, partial [Elusimicrobia bacterium]
CTDVLEELELDTLAELNAQLTDATLVTGGHTTDTNTNANTICTGTDTYLDGNGACDTAATANTVSTLVRRDASGNFSAGTITASTLSGNLSCTDCVNSTEITDIYTFNSGDTMTGALNMNVASGDITSTSNGNIDISPNGTGSVVLGGTTEASGAAAGDVTVTGQTFFGTGGSYQVTSAGVATLAASTIGDIDKNAAAMHMGTSGAASGTADVFVWWDGATGSGTRIMSLNANKELKAQTFTTTGTPDIAEYIMAESDVEAGDVVSVSAKSLEVAVLGSERVQIRKSRSPYESEILGVVADGTSGFQIYSHLKDLDKEHPGQPLVLAGRVPVKVTLENGPIKLGDYLTSSSTPGYAMKATEPGSTIGIALEAFAGEDGKTEGRVLTFVSIGERNSAQRLNTLVTEGERRGQEIDELRRELGELRSLIKDRR